MVDSDSEWNELSLRRARCFSSYMDWSNEILYNFTQFLSHHASSHFLRTPENTHKSLNQNFEIFVILIWTILANFYLDVGSAIKISQFLSGFSTGLIKLSKNSMIFLPCSLSLAWAIKWCCIENGR